MFLELKSPFCRMGLSEGGEEGTAWPWVSFERRWGPLACSRVEARKPDQEQTWGALDVLPIKLGMG